MNWFWFSLAVMPSAALLLVGHHWNPAAREGWERWLRGLGFGRQTVLVLAVGAAYVMLSLVIGPAFGIAFAVALNAWAAWFAWSSWRHRPSAN